jgi:hypothetical protein
MAAPDSSSTVTVTPGKNEKVNNVINIEDILRKATEGARGLLKTGSALGLEHGEKLPAIHQLAADLEKEFRALRAAAPENSGNPPQR